MATREAFDKADPPSFVMLPMEQRNPSNAGQMPVGSTP
jgi:hypothetical protein